MELKIYDDEKVITIKSVDDLPLLPDRSIGLLFNNSNYMVILYVYVLYKLDVYMQMKKYSKKTRATYFNLCVKNLDSFLEYEKEFLISNATTVVIKPEKFPKDLEKMYRDSVLSTCNFFKGMLATTSFLDKQLFSTEDKQTVRHNYGNMIATLLGTVNE